MDHDTYIGRGGRGIESMTAKLRTTDGSLIENRWISIEFIVSLLETSNRPALGYGSCSTILIEQGRGSGIKILASRNVYGFFLGPFVLGLQWEGLTAVQLQEPNGVSRGTHPSQLPSLIAIRDKQRSMAGMTHITASQGS